MPSPDFGNARLARQIDLICSGFVILAGAAVWIGGWRDGPDLDAVYLLRASSLVMLAGALLGLWLMQLAAGWQRLGAALILQAVERKLAQQPRAQAVFLQPEQMAAGGIAGLVQALVWRVRRLNGTLPAPSEPAASYEAALREGRKEAQQVVSSLYQDAVILEEASGEIETASDRLAEDARAADMEAAATATRMNQAADQVVALTGAVRTTTDEVKRMTASAVDLAEQAFAGHRFVADLDDRTAALVVKAGQIEDLLTALGSLGRSAAVEAARIGEAGQPFAPIAADLQEVACSAQAAIKAMQSEVSAMSVLVADMGRTAQEICDRVKAQQELGLALSYAVNQQADEIAGVLRTIDALRSGFVTLRASVEAVSQRGSTRLAKSDTLREAAGRLPAQADTIARILRDLPDFAPSPEFGR